MEGLPQRQRELLDWIAQDARRGRTPVIAELIARMGLARESSLTNLLTPLQRKGLIEVEGGVRGRSRLIALSARGKAVAGLGLPVLGCIAGGASARGVRGDSGVGRDGARRAAPPSWRLPLARRGRLHDRRRHPTRRPRAAEA